MRDARLVQDGPADPRAGQDRRGDEAVGHVLQHVARVRVDGPKPPRPCRCISWFISETVPIGTWKESEKCSRTVRT